MKLQEVLKLCNAKAYWSFCGSVIKYDLTK